MRKTRKETDSIGTRDVPSEAYYGVQSLRAFENFKISGRKNNYEMIVSMAQVKKAAAIANYRVGMLETKKADAMIQACDEIIEGKLHDQFIVDPIQGGAGTSMNMNANEVIANRAIEILGGKKGDYSIIHPNDHVNFGQSTNDAYPSAGKIATVKMLNNLEKQLVILHNTLLEKADEFSNIIKMGRTEMQDAVPIRLGQSFNAYASSIERALSKIDDIRRKTRILNLGATAVGTGINADTEYVKKVVPILAEVCDMDFVQADDLIDATQNIDTLVDVSGFVKTTSVAVSKMANDLRLMSSGPRTGFEEINLPAKQNGSSIMPGKVNPVIPEVVTQVCFNICGNDTAITMAAEAGQLELNAFEPVVFYNLFESIEMLTNVINTFTYNCISGITANNEHCRQDVDNSIGIITAACPYIGYKEASKMAKEALRTGKSIREIITESRILSDDEMERVLDPFMLTKPGVGRRQQL